MQTPNAHFKPNKQKAQVKKPDDNCQRRVTTDGLDRKTSLGLDMA